MSARSSGPLSPTETIDAGPVDTGVALPLAGVALPLAG